MIEREEAATRLVGGEAGSELNPPVSPQLHPGLTCTGWPQVAQAPPPAIPKASEPTWATGPVSRARWVQVQMQMVSLSPWREPPTQRHLEPLYCLWKALGERGCLGPPLASLRATLSNLSKAAWLMPCAPTPSPAPPTHLAVCREQLKVTDQSRPLTLDKPEKSLLSRELPLRPLPRILSSL